MAVTGWKRIRRGARAAVIRAVIRLAMLLPLRVASDLGAAIARLGWLSPRLRREMRASLSVAFPAMSPAERDAIARASLVHLGRVGGEIVTMRRWTPRLDEFVEASPEAVALVERARARGKGIILVIGHIGNWELTNRLAPHAQPSAAIGKRSWHRSLDELTERFRAENGVQTLWREDPSTSRGMLRVLREGGMLGILIDQDIADVQSVFVPFFGRLAATPRSAADLALRFDATLLVICSHRRGPRAWDGHRIELEEVPLRPDAPDREAEVVRVTAACAAIQERAIRRHPAEWVWMHQRWKTRPPVEAETQAGPTATAAR
jgi:KDO2-lipid IV(A) lauroyltransferase